MNREQMNSAWLALGIIFLMILAMGAMDGL